MGFCFPGHDAAGGDLPPRRECARAWHERLFAAMPQLELILAGRQLRPALAPGCAGGGQHDRHGQALARAARLPKRRPRRVPLPHPSWRNNAWLTANPWFERELLPRLRARSGGCL